MVVTHFRPEQVRMVCRLGGDPIGPPPLRQWLVERTEQLRDNSPHPERYRTLDAALAILEGYCAECDQFDRDREFCQVVKGCSGARDGSYRRLLITAKLTCPHGLWTGDAPR